MQQLCTDLSKHGIQIDFLASLALLYMKFLRKTSALEIGISLWVQFGFEISPYAIRVEY